MPLASAPLGDAGASSVEISGCAALREDKGAGSGAIVCELPADRTVRVWASSRFTRLFTSGGSGSPKSSVLREPDGGAVFRVEIPVGANELRVLAGAGADRTFRLAAKSAPEWLDRAKSARQKGDTSEALSIVKEHEASADRIAKAFALGIRARIELAAGHADVAFPLLRESMRLHREGGRLSDAADDGFALAFALNQRSHHYAEARAVLDDVASWVEPYADGRAREAYYRGQLAAETGDARTAFDRLRRARSHAARLGLSVLERNAANAYALALETVGRRAEATEILRVLADDLARAKDAGPCEKVEVAINASYGALLENEEASEGARPADPSPALEAALAATDADCKDRYLRIAVLGDLALAALQRGDVAGARKRLAAAREGATAPRAVERLFWHDLDGRIALAEHDATRALAAFEEELALAESILSFEGQWRAHVGRGMALEALGKNEEALARYRAAEGVLTTLSFLVPLGEGRGTFVGDRGKSARLAVDLLARTSRPADALSIARTSRARVIAGLARSARVEGLAAADRERWEKALGAYRDARAALDAEAKDDWKLTRPEAARARTAREHREKDLTKALDAAFALLAGSNDEGSTLEPLPGDALTLAFHPVRKGFLGLASSGGRTSTFRIEAMPSIDDPVAVAKALLEPIRPFLEGATRLRVLPYGPLRAIDFHALPLDGAPLVQRIAVEYPLDLPRSGGQRQAARDTPIAFVVGDPTLDLDKARVEADRIAGALRDGGAYRVEVALGREATSEVVLAGMERATHLHYAGHGVFAGLEGWESALPLAGGGRLAVGDILAAKAVPARVVLSACESARASSDAAPESLGLAQAFVIAGAELAIAPVRRVDDADAAKTTAALYGALATSAPAVPAKALRDAQLARLREAPSSDWAAFRVVTR
ncbi:MAG: CHAT domain-containing protein [Deltaproteobacteria bacterium]|nr:CHAT domain-containing protein [Deltaproteobacteria bacterium]